MVAKGYTPNVDFPEGVHPALDNRQGDQRPPVETDPAVPQQVDGPDLVHQAEHAAAVAKLRENADVTRKGMFSPGDHGLSGLEARGGNDAGQADSMKETDPENPGSASTDASDAADSVVGTSGSAAGSAAGTDDKNAPTATKSAGAKK